MLGIDDDLYSVHQMLTDLQTDLRIEIYVALVCMLAVVVLIGTTIYKRRVK